ncbi:hypothetical protein GGS24DRAFT_493360 [Hypoxylon argillaceum]|nr:hypothetical protein GGS24DRAFT_493360 [Hypoxylon argillaceum]
MATYSKTPQERLQDLATVIGNLEDGFEYEFTDWSLYGHSSAAEYFLWAYSETINTVKLISGEKWKDDFDPSLRSDLDHLVSRAAQLLSLSIEHIAETGSSLSKVHKGLLQASRRLSAWGDCGTNGLSSHPIRMALQLRTIEPPLRSAWTQDGYDIKPDEEFERIFEEFNALEKDPRNFQYNHELYVSESYRFLEAACEALNIPADKVYPDDNFFSNETRPTFLEYPAGSREFFYGKGSRPGILSAKSSIGALLTTDEADVIKRVRDEGRKKAKKTSKKQNMYTHHQPPNHPKRARTTGDYTMTSINAAADIEDVLRDSKYTELKGGDVDRPDSQRLVTPTVEIRKTMLVPYHDDLRRIIDEIFKRKFGTPTSQAKLPQTSLERSAWLTRATREIDVARASVNELIDVTTTPAKAKLLRLAAYRLKLVRAIYTAGLLAGTPAADQAEIKEGLEARLEDWILHERAWNVAEAVTLRRTGMTRELFDAISDQCSERRANISHWREMLGESSRQPRSRKDEDEAEEEEEEEQGKKEGEEEEQETPDPRISTLTDEEIATADYLLHHCLHPRLPSAGNYLLDEREEGRQRRWYNKVARAKLAGRPIPPWTHKAPFDPFEAGGPPRWKSLPKETVWDRLQYMWVLTYWRMFQLRLLER